MHAEQATTLQGVMPSTVGIPSVTSPPASRPQVPMLGPIRTARDSGGSVPCAHMSRTPRVTSADLLRALHRAGWTTSRQSGSHVILVHPERAGARVVVPVHAGRILKPKTLAAILKSAEIAGDELPGLL